MVTWGRANIGETFAMIPSITAVRLSGVRHRTQHPLLVLGPSLGTSAAALWRDCAAAGLAERFDVLAWDLPGHGSNRSVPDEGFSMAELAAGVLQVVDEVRAERGDPRPFAYAGDSVGGAVGLQLLLDASEHVGAAVLLCTGARLGTAESWTLRAAAVRTSGTPSFVAASAERFFAPGFLEREPARGAAVLESLADTDDAGYALVCEALTSFDVRNRLGQIGAPVLAVTGSHEPPSMQAALQEIARTVPEGRYVELSGVAHLPPVEAPETVAHLVVEHVLGRATAPPTRGDDR